MSAAVVTESSGIPVDTTLLSCPACHEHFRAPPAETVPYVTGPCGHCVCKLCDEAADMVATGKRCLVCGGPGAPAVLNSALATVAEIAVLRLGRPECENDAICVDCWRADEERQVATHMCGKCERTLCDVDASRHTSKGHDVKVLPGVAAPAHLCREHPGTPLSFYCTRCAIPVCRDCTVLAHNIQTHKVEDLQVAATRLGELITPQVGKLALARTRLEENEVQLQSAVELVCSNTEKARELFARTVADAVATLKAVEARMSVELDTLRGLRLKVFSAIKDEMNVTKGQIDAVMSIARGAEASKHPLEMAKAIECLQQRNGLATPMPPLQLDTLCRVVNHIDEFMSELVTVVRIQTAEADPARTVFQGDCITDSKGYNVGADAHNTVSFVVYDKNGFLIDDLKPTDVAVEIQFPSLGGMPRTWIPPDIGSSITVPVAASSSEGSADEAYDGTNPLSIDLENGPPLETVVTITAPGQARVLFDVKKHICGRLFTARISVAGVPVGPPTPLHLFPPWFRGSTILNRVPFETRIKFYQRLMCWLPGCSRIQVIFRSSVNGLDNYSFHYRCDKKGPTLIFALTDTGCIYGAYASVPWTSDSGWTSAPDSFLFTLHTHYRGDHPFKFPVLREPEVAMFCDERHGPAFGGTPYALHLSLSRESISCNMSEAGVFGDPVGLGARTFDVMERRPCMKEMEVFGFAEFQPPSRPFPP